MVLLQSESQLFYFSIYRILSSEMFHNLRIDILMTLLQTVLFSERCVMIETQLLISMFEGQHCVKFVTFFITIVLNN